MLQLLVLHIFVCSVQINHAWHQSIAGVKVFSDSTCSHDTLMSYGDRPCLMKSNTAIISTVLKLLKCHWQAFLFHARSKMLHWFKLNISQDSNIDRNSWDNISLQVSKIYNMCWLFLDYTARILHIWSDIRFLSCSGHLLAMHHCKKHWGQCLGPEERTSD